MEMNHLKKMTGKIIFDNIKYEIKRMTTITDNDKNKKNSQLSREFNSSARNSAQAVELDLSHTTFY